MARTLQVEVDCQGRSKLKNAKPKMPVTDRDALIIFAKPPVPGTVKTRLEPVLSKVQAAELYTAFMRDTFATAARLPVKIRVYVAASAREFPGEFLPEGATLHEQAGEDLGHRMAHAFSETFSAGFERVVIVGTDYPTLPAPVIAQAFRALDSDDGTNVPLGPSDDGGYYLLGLSEPCADIFEMAYSHPRVTAQTLRRIVRTGRLPVLLPVAYDVDHPEDLNRLADELTDAPDRAPYSHRALRAIGVLDAGREITEFSTD
jgi:rSAM/selenodomain-associated transferase 1